VNAQALRIGLTGGIGSGKSTVAAACVRRGATLVDTDAIARRLTQSGGDAMPAIRAEFGAALIAADGALDRTAMRTLAFADASVRRRLEAILHPLIGEQARREADAATSDLIVFDVPLLAESSAWRARVHRVLVVDCSVATQVERVAARPGWTRELAAQVIAAQISRARRRAVADAVIDNDGLSLDALDTEVHTLLQAWKALPRTPVEQ
jgi:dephospho-CoA kinase